ncbi:YggT family protein [Candidatus Parcubacteria bacterium]|nr:MAG: YggT family protein [Candidatus Parcubacteria bacterium]
MLGHLLAQLIELVARLLILLTVVHVILSYFMAPWHPIRRTVDRIIEPLLTPLRRVFPPIGGLDFTPVALILLIELAARVLTSLLIRSPL